MGDDQVGLMTRQCSFGVDDGLSLRFVLLEGLGAQ